MISREDQHRDELLQEKVRPQIDELASILSEKLGLPVQVIREIRVKTSWARGGGRFIPDGTRKEYRYQIMIGLPGLQYGSGYLTCNEAKRTLAFIIDVLNLAPVGNILGLLPPVSETSEGS